METGPDSFLRQSCQAISIYILSQRCKEKNHQNVTLLDGAQTGWIEETLVGASLYAFRELGNGFDRYYSKPDQLSANLNKYLRDHDLLPSENHTVYSLRHSFEDRLTAVEPPDKVQAALMGHRYDRPRYGDGPSLKQKLKWLQKITLDVDKNPVH